MKRLVRYGGIGTLVVAGPVVAYYAVPIVVAIISLGQICPYSPSGTSLCSHSASTKSGPRPVTRTSPALRALGKLAFAASPADGKASDIFVINADGTGLVNLTRSKETDERSPAWSPDGKEIAFSGEGDQDARDIVVINLQSRALRNLTRGTGVNYEPAWSPDGQQIVFASERTDDSTGEYDDHYEIYVRHRNAEVAKLTHNDSDDFEPVWSPDGTMIAFSSKRDGNWEIYAMNADGTAQRNLSDNPADDKQPTWSPDGSKIAFVSDRTDGLDELYVMNPDGTVVRRLTTVPTAKSRPAWSRDSRKIAFINPPDQGIYLMNADGSRMRKLLTGVETGSGLAWQPSTGRLSTPAAPHPSSTVGELCKKPGIRYAGTTREGAEVCFTLTPDRSRWIEIGFRFARASGCPHTTGTATGKTYYEGQVPFSHARITIPGFTAFIRRARASGTLKDPEVCRSKTFRWNARRAP